MSFEFANIPVVIMAGGQGKRMRPYTDILPKPLLGYDNKTMLETVIDNYYQMGVRVFYLLLCYKADLIKSYVENLQLPIEVHYVYETNPLGTAGGLALLKGVIHSDFLMCNCDNLGKFDYMKGFERHQKLHADITIFVKEQHHTIPFGIIQHNDNIVTGIVEKPQHVFLASTGIHIVNYHVLEMIEDDISIDMPDIINDLSQKGKVVLVDVGDDAWIDMSIR